MRRSLQTALLLTGCFLSSLAYAVDCEKADTTVDMRECANIEYEKSDKELNVAYQKLMPLLDKTAQDLLIASEKAWMTYRDNNCAFASDEMRDGSAQPLLYVGCLTNMTDTRTKDMKDFLNSYDDH